MDARVIPSTAIITLAELLLLRIIKAVQGKALHL